MYVQSMTGISFANATASAQGVLRNDDFRLDNIFVASLIGDILRVRGQALLDLLLTGCVDVGNDLPTRQSTHIPW